MTQHRGAVVAWSGAVTAAAIAAATLFASPQKHPFGDPWVILFVVIGAISSLILVLAGIPDVAAWIGDGFRAVLRRERPPELVLTRWSYTSDPVNMPAAYTALEVAVPGTTYMRNPEDPPPWIRYAILLGCGTASTDFDFRAGRDRFLALLDEPPISGLIGALTRVPDDAAWSKRAAHDSAFDAILTSGSDEKAIASARLELPDGTHRFGRDARSAVLIIQVEAPRADAGRAHASWREWVNRITHVLQAVPAFADFLSGQLRLEVTAQPPPTVAIRLETPKDLAQLIGTARLETLPGKQHGRQAIGYFVGFSEGTSAGDAAEQMIRHVLRYALQADV
jgi:hypothetical protein